MPPPSKIAQMPEEIRAWLHKAFVERAFGDIIEITEQLNAKLKEAGVAIYVGKSAVGAESQKVKRAQESIKAATEAAKLLTDTSRDDGNTRGEAVMAMIETDIFDCLLTIREAEAIEDPVERLAIMSKAAKNMAGLSRARVNQARHRLELDARVQAAADKVAKLAKKGGMDASTVEEIRRNILGIKEKAPANGSAAA
ncbi:MAG: DUF3486 family protein [Ramlibacter sp.]|nr:DUF3486 family protein [Ramlibacter sp.]